MENMFNYAINANPDTSNWDTSNVTNMSRMFYMAEKAKPNTSNWDTSKVTDMAYMFQSALIANPNTSNWDTSKVINMSYMFCETKNANPDTSNWDTSKVTDMTFMFEWAKNANPDISDWNLDSLQECKEIFNHSKKSSLDPRFQNIQTVAELKALQELGTKIDIGIVSGRVFIAKKGARYIITGNGEIDKTKFHNATNEIKSKSNYTIEIKDSTVKLPSDSSRLFKEYKTKIDINANIDTSNVFNMYEMFYGATNANPTTTNWKVGNVVNMSFMFYEARNAEPNTSKWNTSNVRNMSNMFNKARKANPNTSNWDTSKVTDMRSMFSEATNANPDVSNWDTKKVKDMTYMFYMAENANPNISKWKLDSLNECEYIFNMSRKSELDPRFEDIETPEQLKKLINDSQGQEEDLNKIVSKIKDEINNNKYTLNELQKDKFRNKLYDAETIDEVNEIVEKINEISKAMKKLNDKMNELIELMENPYITNEDKERIDRAVHDAADKYLILEDDINEILAIIQKMDDVLVEKMELKNYKPMADAFYYTDISIADRVNENSFFDINFSKSIVDVLTDIVNNKFDGADIIGGVQVGANYKVKKDLDLVLGGFAEYQNKVSHNMAIGMNVKYKDFSGFVRYRLALKDSKTNHNIDMYTRYSKLFKLKQLELEPKVGLYLTYSGKVKYGVVELKPRVGVIGDTALFIGYNIGRAKIYAEPRLAFGYNDQKIVQTNRDDNELLIKRGFVDYSLRLGANYKFRNNVTLDGDINIKGDMNKNIKFGTRLGVAYSW